MQASGHGGQLLVGGYQFAARLGNWSLRQLEGDGSAIDAQVTEVDPYWIDRGPFRVVLELGHLRWSWDGVVYQGGPVITVRGAPREGVVEAD